MVDSDRKCRCFPWILRLVESQDAGAEELGEAGSLMLAGTVAEPFTDKQDATFGQVLHAPVEKGFLPVGVEIVQAHLPG